MTSPKTDQRNRNRRREHVQLTLTGYDQGGPRPIDGYLQRHFRCEDNGCGWTGWLIPLESEK